MRWIEKHVTGTPEANKRLDDARDRLAAVPDSVEESPEYLAANEAVWKAMQDVPAPRRSRWV